MTKMHFIAFAEAIRLSGGTAEEKRFAAQIVIDVARQHNGRFDTDRFLTACGLDGGR